jgi:pentatricopeptide repeat domain-containing protein 1
VQQARKFLAEMIGKGIIPDETLCTRLLRKHYELGNIDEAIELQNELVEKGLIHGNSNPAVPNIQTRDDLDLSNFTK